MKWGCGLGVAGLVLLGLRCRSSSALLCPASVQRAGVPTSPQCAAGRGGAEQRLTHQEAQPAEPLSSLRLGP